MMSYAEETAIFYEELIKLCLPWIKAAFARYSDNDMDPTCQCYYDELLTELLEKQRFVDFVRVQLIGEIEWLKRETEMIRTGEEM